MSRPVEVADAAEPDAGPGDAARADRHWRANRRLVAALLAVWCVVSFGALYFARELSFGVFGWPFGFWVAAQGSLVVYVALVGGYQRAMGWLDQACGFDGAEDR